MFDPATGTVRVYVEREIAETQQAQGTLVVDRRRSRPLWFDGRFLTARDLRREQEYLLTRQSDLSAALGSGVISGLEVSLDEDGQIQIQPGVGVAQGGEQVVLTDLLRADPRDIASAASLDRAFGLDTLPATPERTRTGVYALLLRPVAFSANPQAGYPASISADRTSEDEDIVEGTLVTLVPLVEGVHESPERERAWAAARIFRDGRFADLPPGALPLAAIGLDGNRARWVDPWLLRRETEDDAQLALGGAARAERVAMLQHYRDLLSEIPAGAPSAAAHFRMLPPVGPLPSTSVQADSNSDGLIQVFFPPQVDVSLGLIAEDELPCLIEESLALPPFDLEQNAEAHAADAVMILIPVPRKELRSAAHQLNGITTTLRGVGRERDLADRLRLLDRTRVRRLARAGAAGEDGSEPALSAERDHWLARLSAAPGLWYVRRRQLPRSVAVTPQALVIDDDDQAGDQALRERLEEWKLAEAYAKAQELLSDRGRALLSEALSGSALKTSYLLSAQSLATIIDQRGDISLARLAGMLEELAGAKKILLLEERIVPADRRFAAAPLLEDDLLTRTINILDRLEPAFSQEVAAKLGSMIEQGTTAKDIKVFLDEVSGELDVDPERVAVPRNVMLIADKFAMESELERISKQLNADGARVLAEVSEDRRFVAEPIRAAAMINAWSTSNPLNASSAKSAAAAYLSNAFGSGLATLPSTWARRPEVVRSLARSPQLAELDTTLAKLSVDRRAKAIELLAEAQPEGDEVLNKTISQIISDLQDNRPTPTPEPAPTDRDTRPTEPNNDVVVNPVILARTARTRQQLVSAAKPLGLDEIASKAVSTLQLDALGELTEMIKASRQSKNVLFLYGLYADIANGRPTAAPAVIKQYSQINGAALTAFTKQVLPRRTNAAKRVSILAPIAESQLVAPLAAALAKLDTAGDQKLTKQIATILQGNGNPATLRKLILRAGRG